MTMSPKRWLQAAAVIAFASAGCAAPGDGAPGGGSLASVHGTVAWDDWTPSSFGRAKAEKKLILVDVVAEWCHWCHVMDKTTYIDPEVASLIGDNYVAIRVDSDAHPDVAERYKEFGWPATAILTPDARPVLELRGYQEAPEFAALLRSTADDFRAGRPIERNVVSRKAATDANIDRLREAVGAQLDRTYDAAEQGWGTTQKYPVAAPIEREFLLTWLTGKEQHLQRAVETLARETKIIDPVWGGMYQYSTHSDWDHPHFEKIVPVQAGAISNFAQAYAATDNKRWLDPANAVAGYVRNFLTAEDGAFLSSQDADLGAHDDAASGWVDGHVFFALDDAGRRAKGIPRIDTNVYADRNGLLIQAFCSLYEVSRDANVLAAARKAANRIVKTHAGPLGGFTHGDAAPAGPLPMLYLPDQVAMGRAFLLLAEASGDSSWIARADAVAQTLRDRFEDKTGGGFYAHTADPDAVGVFAERQKPFDENSRAARFLLRVHYTTGEELWKESAARTIRFFGDPAAIEDEGRFVGDYLIAIEELTHAPVHLNVVGKAGTKETNALYSEALKFYAPGRIVKLSAPGEEYPDIGKSAVYICSDQACSSPVSDPAKVLETATETVNALK